MDKKELELAGELLSKYSDYLGSRGCNDFWFPENWNSEEGVKFVEEFHIENGDPEEFDNSDHISDFCVAWLLSRKLKEMASKL